VTREAFRNFRLDRITSFEITALRFKREPGKEFIDYLRSL
jgi:predicted DNA-binding transcriptional regulator YafY